MLEFLNMLDELSELVYVVDLETYDLLFMNTTGQKNFGISNVKGHKCYRMLHGKESPCEFCTNPFLSFDTFYTWEITNETVHRHYLLKDKLIQWHGRTARLEIAFDTTEQELQKKVLQNTLMRETFILDCLKILCGKRDFSHALNQVLKIAGEFFGSDRTYIFETCKTGIAYTYEWCAEGISSQICTHPLIPQEWPHLFAPHECIVLEENKGICYNNPKIYEALKEAKVQRAILAPLLSDGGFMGYVGTDNPPAENVETAKLQLETLGYFISAGLQRQRDKTLLETLSYCDTLTHTLNWNAYMRDLDNLKSQSHSSIGFIHLDINGMKEINDFWGHQYGDEILVKTAHTIQSVFTSKEIYRISGDEFSIICSDLSMEDFHLRIRTLRDSFSKNEEFYISLGYGWTARYDHLQATIADTDRMLYEEKKKFYRNKAVSKRYRHENDDILGLTKPNALHDLLHKGNFVVYFQPKFSVENRNLVGAEALVRYVSPQNALIMPDQFIPILESARIIHEIDFYVFDYACKTIARWIAAGKTPTPISVNFSRYSLPKKQFREQLTCIWQKYKIPQNLIEIEITESMDEYENDLFLSAVKDIRKMGFSIAIDDFGVKHANFSLFTTLKFDVLKIDKLFAKNLHYDQTVQIVLRSIAHVCREMNIHMIAEGIETEAQFQVLRQIGCEWAQGYLFDKPLPLPEFEKKYIVST